MSTRIEVAIAIGHHPDDPGAYIVGQGERIHEYHFWSPFARQLATLVEAEGFRAQVIERPNKRPDYDLAVRVNRTRARCAIELHFNSSEASSASGVEMLHWHLSKRGRRLALLLAENTTHALGLKKRRIDGLFPIYGPYPFLQLTRMPAVICEPAFASNSYDAWRLLSRQMDLLNAYGKAIIDFIQTDDR